MQEQVRVLIAGIGGASLGTELAKCLSLAGRYAVYGCDISPIAYGHYADHFTKTFLVNRDGYVESVIDLCKREHIRYIVPGGEEPMILLGKARKELEVNEVRLAGNSSEIIEICSDKVRTFQYLADHGFDVPKTLAISRPEQIDEMVFPCVVKPITKSGGSSFVFLAKDKDEASVHTEYLLNNSISPMLQEYIPLEDGEFTVGVLSLPDSALLGSIALRRLFNAKLSVLMKGDVGLISSGYSQGLIDDFPDVRKTSERIAKALGSVGPINVQGRIKGGHFLPFEINPRFSASAYLRALAGFNEIDLFLQSLLSGSFARPTNIRYGYYLRTLSETFVDKDNLIQ